MLFVSEDVEKLLLNLWSYANIFWDSAITIQGSFAQAQADLVLLVTHLYHMPKGQASQNPRSNLNPWQKETTRDILQLHLF